MISDEVVNKALRAYFDDGQETTAQTVRSAMRAAIEAVAPMLVPGGWQPMATAPKTGEPVILGYIVSHAEEGAWMGDASRNYWGETGWFATDDVVVSSHASKPDAWMPLPEPPK